MPLGPKVSRTGIYGKHDMTGIQHMSLMLTPCCYFTSGAMVQLFDHMAVAELFDRWGRGRVI